MSALVAAGPPSRLLEEAIDGRIELVLPELVLDELERVVVEKLGFAPDRAQAARTFLAGLAAERPLSSSDAEAVTGDTADDAILAAALAAGADFLATGDKRHLLPIGEQRGTKIVTPQAVLAILRLRE